MTERFLLRKIVLTEDGSSTIFLPGLNEHYHSFHGAMQESLHVFMKMGWNVIAEKQDEIDILEIGFGTGLNAFLVQNEAIKFSKKVKYVSIEAFPVSTEEAKSLNYFSNEEEKNRFLNLHDVKWNEAIKVSKNPEFILDKIQIKLEEFIPRPGKYDLIFFDAFSPEKQPELWTEEIFQKMFLAMKQGGILVTYCAKGQVRRNMLAAGFSVERLEGPPGKREMIRARK